MYYYLLAALPYLSDSTEQVPSEEQFLTFCREQLSAEQFEVLASAQLSAIESWPAGIGFLSRYADREMTIRNELARIRAGKTGYSYRAYEAETAFGAIREAVAAATGAGSPLDGERILMALRFSLLTELEQGHFFTFENVLAYYLKLQLIHRKIRMNKDAGQKAFESVYNTISASLEQDGGLSFGEQE